MLSNAELKHEDPISRWHKEVDSYIYKNKISENTRRRIESASQFNQFLFNATADVAFTDELGTNIDNIYAMTLQGKSTQAIAPYRRLYIYQISRFFVALLENFADEAQALGKEEIPFFSEIFCLFYNDDSFALGRKTLKG